MREWTQECTLVSGSVLALVGPDDEYWLAVTTESVECDQCRWEIRWLRRRTTNSRKRTPTPVFMIDTDWCATTIWRDSVIADISLWAKKDENDCWQIEQSTLDQVQALVECDAASTVTDNVNLIPTTITPSGASDTREYINVCDHITQIQTRCTDAINCVSYNNTIIQRVAKWCAFECFHVLFMCLSCAFHVPFMCFSCAF